MYEQPINNVTFKSAMFRPLLPEESQVNPGRYGAELAYWLCIELAKVGVVTTYPNYEDWGWFIEYTTEDGHEFRLCCTNIDGTNDEWHCQVEVLASKSFGRGKPKLVEAQPLIEMLQLILVETEGIEHIRWWYDGPDN